MDVVNKKQKSNLEEADVNVAVVAVVIDKEMWKGNPNEKPTLLTFGGVNPLLLPSAVMLDPNNARVVNAAGLLDWG